MLLSTSCSEPPTRRQRRLAGVFLVACAIMLQVAYITYSSFLIGKDSNINFVPLIMPRLDSTFDRQHRKTVRILLNGGDNMLGRSVQLTFPVQAPGEENITDVNPASKYLNMALHLRKGQSYKTTIDEIRNLNRNGSYLWKAYQDIVIQKPVDIRILNFESAITKSINNSDVQMQKLIRYHSHSDNLDAMLRPFAETTHGATTASPVVVSLVNNHAMDYGRQAFEEETTPTLDALKASIPQISTVGMGANYFEASAPALVSLNPSGSKVEVFAFSTRDSGTPESWYATTNRSGLVGLPGLYNHKSVREAIEISKRVFGDHASSGERLRVVSIHMGPNWAMKKEKEQRIAARREYAHWLIDECSVDLIYGHSSHHTRGMEVYNGKLILYGTGDMINDYEGYYNPGSEHYNKLGGIYIADIDANTGNLQQLKIVPMFMNELRLERYTRESKIWNPKRKRLETNATKSENLCEFMNKLSRIDSGESETALMMKHVDVDPDIPGGPILISRDFSS